MDAMPKGVGAPEEPITQNGIMRPPIVIAIALPRAKRIPKPAFLYLTHPWSFRDARSRISLLDDFAFNEEPSAILIFSGNLLMIFCAVPSKIATPLPNSVTQRPMAIGDVFSQKRLKIFTCWPDRANICDSLRARV